MANKKHIDTAPGKLYTAFHEYGTYPNILPSVVAALLKEPWGLCIDKVGISGHAKKYMQSRQ